MYDLMKLYLLNKKLAWIEATPNDLDNWKQYYSLSASSSEMGGTSEIP
jgi:hypothetical protein